MLIAHIAIALSSLLIATLAVVTPKLAAIRLGYGLAALTFASGTYLVFMGASIVQFCLSGAVYFSIVAGLLAVARTKLARTSQQQS
jgi:hypothetical protein